MAITLNITPNAKIIPSPDGMTFTSLLSYEQTGDGTGGSVSLSMRYTTDSIYYMIPYKYYYDLVSIRLMTDDTNNTEATWEMWGGLFDQQQNDLTPPLSWTLDISDGIASYNLSPTLYLGRPTQGGGTTWRASWTTNTNAKRYCFEILFRGSKYPFMIPTVQVS